LRRITLIDDDRDDDRLDDWHDAPNHGARGPKP
jgi:hypothetical protein